MRPFLENLCTTDAAARRGRLEAALRARFGARLRVERRAWGPGHPVAETVNYLVGFGGAGGHLLLGAHYDQVPGSPGGNDNGAAVTQLFCAASRLQAALGPGAPEPRVTFAFFDQEERLGSPVMGSRVYAEDHAGALPEKAVIYDVTGAGELFVSLGDATGLLPEFQARWTPPSDHVNLQRAGVPATLVCALPAREMGLDFPPTWATLHTPGDTPGQVSDHALEQGARLALDLVTRFRAA